MVTEPSTSINISTDIEESYDKIPKLTLYESVDVCMTNENQKMTEPNAAAYEAGSVYTSDMVTEPNTAYEVGSVCMSNMITEPNAAYEVGSVCMSNMITEPNAAYEVGSVSCMDLTESNMAYGVRNKTSIKDSNEDMSSNIEYINTNEDQVYTEANVAYEINQQDDDNYI